MRNDQGDSRNRRQGVSIPDFKRETDREYQYGKRPNQKGSREQEHNPEYQKRKQREEERERRSETRKNRLEQARLEEERRYHEEQKALKKQSIKSQKKKNQKSKEVRKKRRKKIFHVFFVCIAIVAGFLFAKVELEVNQILDKKNEGKIQLDEVEIDESKLDSDDQIINILLVGADKRETWSEAGRSDATMIATIDKKHRRLKLVSLMRDMYVEIPNHGSDKFNAAYSYGGVELLYKTIATNFDLKLDGYVLVDFGAFKKVIKSLGGVKIELTEAEANYLIKAYKHGTETKVKPGMNNLNGRQALAYARIRQDAEADFGRTARQRKVLQSLFTKIKTKDGNQLMNLMKEIMPYITTDLGNDQIIAYAKNIVGMGTTEIDQKRIPINQSFTPQRIRGMEVLVPDLEKNKKELWSFIFEFDGKDDNEEK